MPQSVNDPKRLSADDKHGFSGGLSIALGKLVIDQCHTRWHFKEKIGENILSLATFCYINHKGRNSAEVNHAAYARDTVRFIH